MTDPAFVRAEASVDGTSYEVLSLRVTMRHAALGEARCELSDFDGGPSPAALIGKPAVLTLTRDDDHRAAFAGIVVEASHVGGETTRAHAEIVVVPRLWRLSRRTDCRVFQGLTVEEIVDDVCDRAGVADREWTLTHRYEPRVYCVQHRETDLAFVERLLAEEGISFTVETRGGIDVVCFTDEQLGPVEGATSLPYKSEFGFDTSRDVVEALEQVVSIRSDRATVRDYDFERPDFELAGRAEGSGEGDKTLETYLFPARSSDEATVQRRAQVVLESLQCRRDQVVGETGALHLVPGRTFSITDHPYAPFNREYLLLEVEHRFRAAAWGASDADDALGCRFVAMPLEVGPFRPERRRAREVPGFDSAVVVGPVGSEIHPDEYGRVKVQFPWDREGDGTDAASAFMRTFQVPLAGGILTPRVGWEVTCRNLEGDPDLPVVSGRMFTAKAPPPYALPEHKARMAIQTATSPGGGSVNELRFDDEKGAEEMFMNASKDMSVGAGNNATESIGGNETRTIGANQDIEITGAMSSISASQTWQVGGNQKVGVSTYMVDQNGGAHLHSVGGNRDLTIGGDHRALVGGASSLSVGGMQVDLVAGSVVEASTSPMTDTIGAALVELAAGGRSVICASRAETIGAAKVVLASGGRGVEVGGTLSHDVGAAMAIKASGDINDNSGGELTDVAGGAQMVKATNVTFTAKTLLTVVCGGSTLTLTPASVTLAGATVTLDGVNPATAAMVKDN